MNQAKQTPKTDDLSNKGANFLINFVTGGLSGVIAKTMTAPIERVKLLLQTQHANDKILRPYNGIKDCFYRTITEEGYLALWRGNLANVIRYFPTQALNFAFKEIYKDLFLTDRNKAHNSYAFVFYNLLSGGLAGCTSTMFVYPLDVARTRLGVDVGKTKGERQFTGVFDCISKLYKANGIRGLYKGLGASLVGIFIYRGLYFGIYDSGKNLVINPEKSSLFERFLFAQACVIFSESISYPTDTVKRRLMLQAARTEVLYTGAFDCTRKIWKAEGVKGFWKGNLTNVYRSVGSSICLVLYDEMKRYTDKYAVVH